jgi:hypothetical protein
MPRWNTHASTHFGGDINRLKCTDADLGRPGRIKYQYATYITEFEPGKSKVDRIERDAQRGPLYLVLEIDHWALEEYFWHGVPGDTWDPMEAYLDFVGDRLSGAGKTQLRQWKPAENLYCSMGYSIMPKVEEAEAFELNLNLRRPELVIEPLPWKKAPQARRRYLREWRQRNWNT